MDLADPSLKLQNDIRKLKLELMRQELDDKMLTLKFLVEKQRQQNATTQSTTTLDPSESYQYMPIGSILFVNVFGEFLVWHFVLLVLFVWVIIIILIKYTWKLASMRKAKKKRRNTLRLKKELRAKNKKIEKSTSNITTNDESAKQNQQLQISTISNTQDNENDTVLNKSVEYFLPPKREFFLYTIHEHEIQTKKVFAFKQKQQMQSSDKKHLIGLNRSISKSDSNLLQIKNDYLK